MIPHDAMSAPRTLLASGPKPEVLTFTAPVTITAAAAEGESPGAGPRLARFEMNAYDGSALNLADFFSPVVVDLQGARARHRVKAFYEHDRERIVGHMDKVTIDQAGIRVAGVVSGTGAHVKEIIESAKNGFEWESSIGAEIVRREFVQAGTSVAVNGRSFQGPLIVARETVIVEASFTAIGAAEDSSAKIAAGQGTHGVFTMTFEQWLQAKGFNLQQLNDEQRKFFKAAYDAEIAATSENPSTSGGSPGGPGSPGSPGGPAGTGGGAADPASAPAPIQATGAPGSGAANPASATNSGSALSAEIAAVRGEYARIGGIEAICARHKNPRITIDGAEVDLKAHAIAQGWTVDQTELQALRASRPQAPLVSVGATSGGPDSARVIEASMCLSVGCAEDFIGDQYGEQVVNAAMGRDVRGFTLGQLIHASLAANGGHSMFGRLDDDTIEAALRTDPMLNGQMILAAGGFSTISLSGILSNVANKAMLERFEMLESVVSEIAYETDTNNFKQFTRYRLDGKGTFSEVGPDGELKHIELVESEYANQLKTHGGMITLTRVMITNDDLGAFLQIPYIFVELAMHAREQGLFTVILANGGNFFHADNGNLLTGADSALAILGLNNAVKAYREQTNAGGKFIMVSPRKVVTPPAIEATAKQLYTSTALNETTTANKAKPQDNPHKGSFKPIASPYLGTASGLSGSSDTAWYLLPEPGTSHAIAQVGYLRGQRRPTLGSAQANFNVLGMQWRSYWDFGIALHEQRAGVKNDGA